MNGDGGRDRKQGEDDKRSAEKERCERSAVSWPKMIAVIKTTGHNHAGTVAVPGEPDALNAAILSAAGRRIDGFDSDTGNCVSFK